MTLPELIKNLKHYNEVSDEGTNWDKEIECLNKTLCFLKHIHNNSSFIGESNNTKINKIIKDN